MVPSTIRESTTGRVSGPTGTTGGVRDEFQELDVRLLGTGLEDFGLEKSLDGRWFPSPRDLCHGNTTVPSPNNEPVADMDPSGVGRCGS